MQSITGIHDQNKEKWEYTGQEVKPIASFTNSGSHAISTWVAPPYKHKGLQFIHI